MVARPAAVQRRAREREDCGEGDDVHLVVQELQCGVLRLLIGIARKHETIPTGRHRPVAYTAAPRGTLAALRSVRRDDSAARRGAQIPRSKRDDAGQQQQLGAQRLEATWLRQKHDDYDRFCKFESVSLA